MNKGYLIAHVTVSDPVAYADYARAAGEAMQAFNPKIVAWSGQYENLEGEAHERHVVFEFESFAEAKGFYESPAYQAARLLRAGAAHGTFVLVEGPAFKHFTVMCRCRLQRTWGLQDVTSMLSGAEIYPRK